MGYLGVQDRFQIQMSSLEELRIDYMEININPWHSES
jgi:hypothetical protein